MGPIAPACELFGSWCFVTLFIIGGEKLYSYALEHNLVDRIIISLISGKHEGDTYFPKLDSSWKEVSSANHKTFKEIVYERN